MVKLKKYLSGVFVLLLVSCSTFNNSVKKQEYWSTPMEYSFMTVNFKVKFILLEYYPTEIYCFTEGGTPYGVLIGKPLKSHLPERVSFLARCEDGDFKKGDTLTAQVIEQSKSLPPLKTFITHINGNTRVNQLLGAQHPALWCEVEKA